MNIQLNSGDSRYAVLRITEQNLRTLEAIIFRRYPVDEWATFFRFGFRRTTWGLVISLVDFLSPETGDLDEDSPMVVFKAHYSRRALLIAEKRELAMGVVHSHPLGTHVLPSLLDDDMDGYFADEFGAYSGGAPYVSLIVLRAEDGTLRFSGRVYDSGEWLPVSEAFVTGPRLERLESALSDVSRYTPSAGIESPTARLEMIYGDLAAQRLRGATIGVVGCSGTGSPAVHALARAGIRRFVLVDFDVFSPSNHERFHGSTWEDCICAEPRRKADMLAALIRSINPQAEIIVCHGNALDGEILDELLRCDLVLGCTDSHHARLALSEYSIHYVLPVIDTGVLMEGKAGAVTGQTIEFTRYDASLPCALCGETIDTQVMNVELMSPDAKREAAAAAEQANARGLDGAQYWKGAEPVLPTVGYLTGTAGNLLAGYAVGWITGAFAMPDSRFQCDIGFPQFGYVNRPRSWRAVCKCRDTAGWGDEAQGYRNVTRPEHWPAPKIVKIRPPVDL